MMDQRRAAVRRPIEVMRQAPGLSATAVAEHALRLLSEPERFSAMEPLKKIAAEELAKRFDLARRSS